MTVGSGGVNIVRYYKLEGSKCLVLQAIYIPRNNDYCSDELIINLIKPPQV